MNFMYFLAILIGPLMKVLYSFIGNYAVTIIVATIIMKLLLFPLAIHQQKLRLLLAGRQPLRALAALLKYRHCVFVQRPVARGRLAVPGLGPCLRPVRCLWRHDRQGPQEA